MSKKRRDRSARHTGETMHRDQGSTDETPTSESPDALVEAAHSPAEPPPPTAFPAGETGKAEQAEHLGEPSPSPGDDATPSETQREVEQPGAMVSPSTLPPRPEDSADTARSEDPLAEQTTESDSPPESEPGAAQLASSDDSKPGDETPPPGSASLRRDTAAVAADEMPPPAPLRSDVAPRSARSDEPADNAVQGLASLSEEETDLQDPETFLKGLVESLLFSSPQPLSAKDIARLAGVDRLRAKELIDRLASEYSLRGLTIEEVASGYVMRSAPRYGRHVQKLLGARPVRLSRAQLETLAIVAYRQPVTKPEVDDIRGVDSGQVIKGLLERSLVKILGKKDEPGRPMLYGTTTDFLELLNLQSLKDLPTLREYSELSDESRRKFVEETGDDVPIVDPATSQFAGAEDPSSSPAPQGEDSSPEGAPPQPASETDSEDPPHEGEPGPAGEP